MATVLLNTGEVREVPDNEMLIFLQQNRELIQNRQSPRKRPIKTEESVEIPITNTK
jgi:hypothetical protein